MQTRSARSAYVAVAILFVLATIVQVFLAGLALMAGEDIDTHRYFGFAMYLMAVLLVVLAFLGRLDRTATFMSVALLVVAILQSVWVSGDGTSSIRAIHPTMALLIFGLAIDLMRRGLLSMKASPAE